MREGAGNRRRHVSPDVFVVRGLGKVTDPPRRRYLLWENKPIDLVIELTSESTRREDEEVKLPLYRDVLGVKEYFLFDPFDEYLDPSLQGYRRSRDQFVPIRPVDGRLPSKVLGLHLERENEWLRLYNPATQQWLRTPPEEHEALQESEQARQRAEQTLQASEQARVAAQAEAERLRRELEELRRRFGEQAGE
jgi:hypothetical protein